MEWSDRMNAAIGYIEDNLAGETDVIVMADKACCSVFHFQRMFFAILGLTPAEYIRRRKLTLAARDITSSDTRIIDIAVKYGYTSPVSFARAFRNVHGINPRAARKPGVKLSAFPRISFSITLKGGVEMDYRMIEKPAFEIMARSRRFSMVGGQNFIEIPKFWDEYMQTPEYQEMCSIAGDKPGKITGGGLGICYNESENGEQFSYGIGIEIPSGAAASKFETIPVPAAFWAVFDCTLRTIQDVTKRIFSEWFPSTGYEHANVPELEVYFSENPQTKEIPCQIWIPVVKKN